MDDKINLPDYVGKKVAFVARVTTIDQSSFCGRLGTIQEAWAWTDRSISNPPTIYYRIQDLDGVSWVVPNYDCREWLTEPKERGH